MDMMKRVTGNMLLRPFDAERVTWFRYRRNFSSPSFFCSTRWRKALFLLLPFCASIVAETRYHLPFSLFDLTHVILKQMTKHWTIQSIMEVRKTTTDELQCRICGDRASRKYVGVVVCASCKMFFKRNAAVRTRVGVHEKTLFFAIEQYFRPPPNAISMVIVRSRFLIGMHVVLVVWRNVLIAECKVIFFVIQNRKWIEQRQRREWRVMFSRYACFLDLETADGVSIVRVSLLLGCHAQLAASRSINAERRAMESAIKFNSVLWRIYWIFGGWAILSEADGIACQVTFQDWSNRRPLRVADARRSSLVRKK